MWGLYTAKKIFNTFKGNCLTFLLCLIIFTVPNCLKNVSIMFREKKKMPMKFNV